MSETINGWAPPIIYDYKREEKRIATQDDIDRLEAIAADYNRLCRELRKLGWNKPPSLFAKVPEAAT